jgi:hypothetical protein
MNTIRLSDLFRYYKQLPHQMAAVVELEAELLKRVPDLFNRDQPWFKTWSQAGKQPDPIYLEPALRIIKEFEGCHLVAYADPVGIWTIGWGNIQIDGRPSQARRQDQPIHSRHHAPRQRGAVLLRSSTPSSQQPKTTVATSRQHCLVGFTTSVVVLFGESTLRRRH